MGGVLDKAALPGRRLLKPVQHLVQGASESAQLVVSLGNRERSRPTLTGDAGRSAAELLHGTQGTPQRQPDGAGQQERQRRHHAHERDPQRVQHTLDVTQRQGHHHRDALTTPLRVFRHHPCLFVVRAPHRGRSPALQACNLVGREHGKRSAGVGRARHHQTGPVKDLRDLAGFRHWQW